MNQSYPEMRFVFPAYFNQDFDLDYVSVAAAIDEIIADYKHIDRMKPLIDEIRFAIASEDILDREFFEKLGLDTSPCEDESECRQFLEVFLDKYMQLTSGAK